MSDRFTAAGGTAVSDALCKDLEEDNRVGNSGKIGVLMEVLAKLHPFCPSSVDLILG
jgi:hypothetical protein